MLNRYIEVKDFKALRGNIIKVTLGGFYSIEYLLSKVELGKLLLIIWDLRLVASVILVGDTKEANRLNKANILV